MVDPLRPSAAIADKYQSRLEREIDAMARDLTRQLSKAYRANPPEHFVMYGQDASPAVTLNAAFQRVRRNWLRRFDTLSANLAKYFATAVQDRNERVIRDQMLKAGFTVKRRISRAQNDAFQAIRAENVGLIKSIPEQHLTSVGVLLNQAVQAGGDLKVLTDGLVKQHGVTRRRAARIAHDQNRKATASLQRAKWLELGITRAKWLHSAGGKTPRPEHVAFNGKTYDVAKGHDFDNGEGIVWPGTAINCRCVSVPIIPGLD